MKMLRLAILGLLGSASFAFAQEISSENGYYTIKESLVFATDNSAVIDPIKEAQQLLAEAGRRIQQWTVGHYSLVSFDFHNDQYGDVNEVYNRKKHFGSWIRDPRDGTCFNTRAKVLMRDSQEEVGFGSSRCVVATGRWIDPYAGDEFTDAKEIQVDHFVPLKHAYTSGAYKWNSDKRCLYANFLGNNFHLLSVYGKENNIKSDNSPEDYMPPNSDYQCQYLAQWLKIKLIWKLALKNSEKRTIVALIQQNNCSLVDFTFSEGELEGQRQFIRDNMGLCEGVQNLQ